MTTETMRFVHTEAAPAPVGPYSQAVRTGQLLFVSGQVGLEPGTSAIAANDVEAQTERALRNVAAVIAAAGGSPQEIVKTTIFLVDMDEFARVNRVYAKFFGEHRPARSTVEVSRLPLDAKVEIEAVAVLGEVENQTDIAETVSMPTHTHGH